MIHIEGMKKMYKIACKKELNSAVTYMEIEAPFVAKKAKAGQFIIFRVDDKSERVPLTIAGYDREKGTVAIIFQKVGLSTELLGSLNEGDYIQDFVGPLGKPTLLWRSPGKKPSRSPASTAGRVRMIRLTSLARKAATAAATAK